MNTNYFNRQNTWGTYGYFLTPGPFSNNDMSYNCITVNLNTQKIDTIGKKYNFFIDYDKNTSTIIYGARPLDAVGYSVRFATQKGTEQDFLNKVQELDSKEEVKKFLNQYMGKHINYLN